MTAIDRSAPGSLISVPRSPSHSHIKAGPRQLLVRGATSRIQRPFVSIAADLSLTSIPLDPVDVEPSEIPRTRMYLRQSVQASMARPKITLYVDTVSPFAYEAFYVLRVRDLVSLYQAKTTTNQVTSTIPYSARATSNMSLSFSVG